MAEIEHTAAPGGFFPIGGDMPVARIGFGTMRLTGPGTWYHGDKAGRRSCCAAPSNSGSPTSTPPTPTAPNPPSTTYAKPCDATPNGYPRASSSPPRAATPVKAQTCGRRAGDQYLMQCIAMSQRRLALERIDLYYLHRIDPKVPFEEQIGVLAEAKAAGSIRHIGLCRVTVEQIRQAQQIAPIAAVQNKYNHQGGDKDVIDYCAANGSRSCPSPPSPPANCSTTSRTGTRARPPNRPCCACFYSTRVSCRSQAPPTSPTSRRTAGRPRRSATPANRHRIRNFPPRLRRGKGGPCPNTHACDVRHTHSGFCRSESDTCHTGPDAAPMINSCPAIRHDLHGTQRVRRERLGWPTIWKNTPPPPDTSSRP